MTITSTIAKMQQDEKLTMIIYATIRSRLGSKCPADRGPVGVGHGRGRLVATSDLCLSVARSILQCVSVSPHASSYFQMLHVLETINMFSILITSARAIKSLGKAKKSCKKCKLCPTCELVRAYNALIADFWSMVSNWITI